MSSLSHCDPYIYRTCPSVTSPFHSSISHLVNFISPTHYSHYILPLCPTNKSICPLCYYTHSVSPFSLSSSPSLCRIALLFHRNQSIYPFFPNITNPFILSVPLQPVLSPICPIITSPFHSSVSQLVNFISPCHDNPSTL